MNLANFIVAGCSFSAGTNDKELAINCPTTWSHFLLKKLNPTFFYNLAIPKSGNYSISTNLIYLLESKNHINPENTIIGINFTGLDRIDNMCSQDHPNANRDFSWDHDFKFGWITEGTFITRSQPYNGILQKNIGFEQTKITNCIFIIQCISYLEARNFNYFFMLMNDTIIDAPSWFTNFLNSHKDKWITFDNNQNMHEFSKSKNLLVNDTFHPLPSAHKLMAEHISNKLQLN